MFLENNRKIHFLWLESNEISDFIISYQQQQYILYLNFFIENKINIKIGHHSEPKIF